MLSGRFSRFVVGVDLGATHCRAALFSPRGEMGNRLEKQLPHGDADEQVRFFLVLLEDLLAGEELSGLLGIGIGSCGPIDRERETVLEAPNRPGWNNVPLRRRVEERFSVPVSLENDANVAAFGEHRRGAGRGVRSLLGLTLGTGVGGGFIQDGRILVGAGGMAGEVGHIYIGGEGIRCRCGAVDCLEVYASAEGIKRTYQRRLGEPKEISCHAIFHLAREGDRLASEVIREASVLLGRGIASLQKVLDPDRIVIGGGLAREWDLLVEPAIREARDSIFVSQRDRFEVLPASLGTDAGLVGAAELVISRL
ncbi:MAG: ROK family protein [Candidatus Eisenbacteria bacterium]|nr:ROK family protein [Candidatus Eisenbacteria bacterium]